MALVKCRECGADISDQAAKCPACGKPRLRKSGKIAAIGCGTILGLFVVVVAAIVIATMGDAPPKPNLTYTVGESFDLPPAKWQVTVVVPKQGGRYPAQADLEAIAKYIAHDKASKLGPVDRWWVSFTESAQAKQYYADVHQDKGAAGPAFAWFVQRP
jgi:hypothetical protein